MGCLCATPCDRSQLDQDVDESATTTTVRCGERRRRQPMPADICGLQNTKFIIKGGTHCIEVGSLRNEVSLSVSNMTPLRESCKHGDHYLAKECEYYPSGQNPKIVREKIFYVIKGKSCIQVESLSDDGSSDKTRRLNFEDLHRKCQGGNFYCANKSGFYIIRNRNSTVLHVRNMYKRGYQSRTASRYRMHESFTKGLNYFATEDYFYVLKKHEEFGLVYLRTKDLRSNTEAEMFPVSNSIASIVTDGPVSLNHNQQHKDSASTIQPSANGCPDNTSISLLDNELPSPTIGTQLPPGSVIGSETTVTELNAKPDSFNLSMIKWKNERGKFEIFRLKDAIIHQWKDIGDLIVPRQKLEAWDKEKNAKACCDAVISYWLDNPPPHYPATWEGLYELLNDSQLGQVAANLNQAVNMAKNTTVYTTTL